MYDQPLYGQPVYGQPMMQTPIPPQNIQPMYMQPAYIGPLPPMRQPPPTIISIGEGSNGKSFCNICQRNTGQYVEKTIGCAVVTCSLVHMLLIGPFFFIVCLADKYKDIDTFCSDCKQLKHSVPGDACKK